MSATRVLIAMFLSGSLLFQTSQVEAQSIASCVVRAAVWAGTVLATTLIESFAKGAGDEAGKETAKYFLDKAKSQGNSERIEISQSDIDRLEQKFQRKGFTKCALRDSLETLASTASEESSGVSDAPSGYSATAHCSVTGFTGESYDQETPREALEAAIEDCIDQGGIPKCCRQGAKLVGPR